MPAERIAMRDQIFTVSNLSVFERAAWSRWETLKAYQKQKVEELRKELASLERATDLFEKEQMRRTGRKFDLQREIKLCEEISVSTQGLYVNEDNVLVGSVSIMKVMELLHKQQEAAKLLKSGEVIHQQEGRWIVYFQEKYFLMKTGEPSQIRREGWNVVVTRRSVTEQSYDQQNCGRPTDRKIWLDEVEFPGLKVLLLVSAEPAQLTDGELNSVVCHKRSMNVV